MRQLHNELSKSFFSKHEKEKSKLIEIHFLKEGGGFKRGGEGGAFLLLLCGEFAEEKIKKNTNESF